MFYNKLSMKYLTVLLFALYSFAVSAAPVETYKFESDQTEKTFHKLNEELRCLVCQNQNIAESNADLAKDLRLEIYTMLSNGKTEDEIIAFMVKRYGDYVLYRPPFNPMTWLLWFSPAIVFFIGLFFVMRYFRAQQATNIQEALNPEEVERIKDLHAQQENKE